MPLQPGDTVLYEARFTKNNVGVIGDVGLTTVTMIDGTTVDKKFVLRLLKPVPIPGNPSMANTVIVFSVDVTSSMGLCFDHVKAAIAGIKAIPEGVGIILQVFTEKGAKCLAGCISFDDDLAAFKQYVSDMLLTYVGLECGSGGDTPENHIYAMFQLKDYLAKFYLKVVTVFTFVFTDAGVHYNSVPSPEADAETKALNDQFGVSVTDAYARLALLLDQPYEQTVMFMACTQSPDPWLAHLAKATEGLTLLCSGNLTDDLQRLIDSLFTITQGGTIGTVGFTSMTPHTITNKLPANEKVADRKIDLQKTQWGTMFARFVSLVAAGKKFKKRLTVRGAGEATALVHLILDAENAATSAEESDILAQVIPLFDPADQPFVEAAWHALVQAFKDGVSPDDTMCEITFATLREQLQEMKGLPNDKAFAQLGQLVSGIMANLRFMKRPDGSLDLANAWCLSIDPKKVGTSVVTLETFGSLHVDGDGYRLDPSSRYPCNILVPWCPTGASPVSRAIFNLLCACRFVDTVTTGILTGGTDCFPSMHPGMVICLAWALMTGDSERDTTLVRDAFNMVRRYPRPLSRTLHHLFNKGQGSPEPSPQQLLASFLWWAQKNHVVVMPQSIMAEFVQAFAMVNARYEEEFDWASLVNVSDFDPLLGAHPVEGELFTLCPVAWMETLHENNVSRQAERFVAVLNLNGIEASVDPNLIAQCLLLADRTARYTLTAGVHVAKTTMPPLAVLLGAKVAEAVRRKFSPKWAAAREAFAEANLVEQVVAAVEASDSVPVLAAKLKEISFLPPWVLDARGIKKVSRAHLALLFDKLGGDKLKLAVMAFLDDSWTTESVLMLKSLSANIVAVLGEELKESFTARMSARVACKRQEIAEGVTPDGKKIHPVTSNRHGHSKDRQAASVLDDAPPLRNRFHIPPDAFRRMLEEARAEVKKIRDTPLSKAARDKMEEFFDKNEVDYTSFQAPRAPTPVHGRPVTAPLSRARRYLKALQALDTACEAYAKLDAKPPMTKLRVYKFFETPMEAITRSSSVSSLERRAKFWAERR